MPLRDVPAVLPAIVPAIVPAVVPAVVAAVVAAARCSVQKVHATPRYCEECHGGVLNWT